MSITERQKGYCEGALPAERLPIRPQPIKDEAAVSYLIRLAQSNGFGAPRQLWNAISSGRGRSAFDVLLDRANVSSQDRASLVGPLPNYWKYSANLVAGLSIIDYNHHFIRWCPLCLAESAHLYWVWGLKLQCVCTRHQIMLVDCCPECGASQRIERSDVARCSCCDAWLAAAERVAAAEAMCRLCEYLAYGTVGGALRQYPELDAAQWHRVVYCLGQFTIDPPNQRSGKIAGLCRLEVATELVGNAAILMADWPRHFNMLLSIIQERSPASQSLQRSYGRLYRVLYRDLQEPCFQFLRDTFELHLHENWWGLVCRRNRSLRVDTVANHPRLTLKAAARQAGTSPSVVRHIVQAELIPGVEGELPSGRHIRSVHQRDIEQIVILSRGAMTLHEASCFLALPERRLRELVMAGILNPIVSRRKTTAAAWLFSREELARYASITGLRKQDVQPVMFKQILKSWRLREGEFVALVTAIETGDLVSVAEGSAVLGEVLLDSKAVRTWLEARRVSADEWISVDQAARLLGLKQQVTYGLVAKGVLLTTVSDSGARRIHMDNLRAFKETYVSLVELARHLHRSPKSALQALEAVPVSGPTVDGMRQYFYRREDVLNLLAVAPSGGVTSLDGDMG